MVEVVFVNMTEMEYLAVDRHRMIKRKVKGNADRNRKTRTSSNKITTVLPLASHSSTQF